MRILVPTDFSDQSRTALAEAVAWADFLRGEILLLHVAPTPFWPLLEVGNDPDLQGFGARLQDASSERLLATQAAAIRTGVTSEVHVVEGTPHVEIARFVREWQCDLLVIATHGHSRLKRFLLGSTTERIVGSSPCPVLVVRDSGLPPDRERRGVLHLGRILAATDFSESSVRALGRAVGLAGPSRARLVLLHVLRAADHPIREVMSRTLWSGIQRRCEEQLDEIRMESIPNDLRSGTLLAEGIPSAKIADVAREHKIDLIVLGAHGHHGDPDGQIGSTAERVARIAPCSVYIEKGGIPAGR